jgi:hypothetical protein
MACIRSPERRPSRNNLAWVVAPGSSAPAHRHVGDAVELILDGATTPKTTFVAAGTVHAGPAAGAGGRAFIFEIK